MYSRNVKKIKITADQSEKMGYEKKRCLYFFTLPIMYLLALWVLLKKNFFSSDLEINSFWFDGVSPTCKEIRETSTTWRALDIIYNYQFDRTEDFSGRITNFWLKIINAQSVRNRLKLVKRILRETFRKILAQKKEVRLLSIASGSAQGVIEIIAEFKEKNIKVMFLDLDLGALEYSKRLAREAGVLEQITFVNKSIRKLEEVTEEFNPNIVEITGFLPYKTDEKAIKLIQKIYKILSPDGVALINHVSPNSEQFFLYSVINWSMIYRTPKQFASLLIQGGFSPENCEIICEPLKIHEIGICNKFYK